MEKMPLVFLAVLLCCGCGGTTVSSPDEILSTETVVDGFGNEPAILTNTTNVRVGTYYDFSMYDSLRVSFTATRLSTERPFDEIIVKIGPMTYLRDTVYAVQENVSLSVKVSRISKSNFAALTFWTTDPRTVLQLSGLHIIGWKSE